ALLLDRDDRARTQDRGRRGCLSSRAGCSLPPDQVLRRRMHSRRDNSRHIAAPTGPELSCRSWATEAAMRMLMNNLDPRVAEAPEALVVYGGIGRAARDWESYDAIVATLK